MSSVNIELSLIAYIFCIIWSQCHNHHYYLRILHCFQCLRHCQRALADVLQDSRRYLNCILSRVAFSVDVLPATSYQRLMTIRFVVL